jgi:hypothetical protein
MGNKLEYEKRLSNVIQVVKELHTGVRYGANLQMYDQVLRTAEIIYDSTKNIDLTKIALLHKCKEVKRINNGKP